LAEGSICIVWKPDKPSTSFTGNPRIYNADFATFRLLFDATNDWWELEDGTNNVTSAVQTFSAGDIIIFHVVYKPGELTLYKNGVSIASGATYTPSTAAITRLWIGGQINESGQTNGTYMNFTTFAQAMSATEVSDDYTNILGQVEDDRRLSPIPWLWTKDGDDIVDNCNDSTRDNFCVIGGVPGNDPAETIFKMIRSTTTSPYGLLMTLTALKEYMSPASVFYGELQGTVDGGSSGGEYKTTTVGASAVVLGQFTPDFKTKRQFRDALAGKSFRLITRLKDAGSNLQLGQRYFFQGTATLISSKFRTVSADTNFKMFYTDSIDMLVLDRLLLERDYGTSFVNPTIDLMAKRSSGSAAVDADFFFFSFQPTLFLETHTSLQMILKGNKFVGLDSDEELQEFREPGGDDIECEPGCLNILQTQLTDDTGKIDITDTLTYDRVYVVPRWALL
jgi:hypothetical protein